MPEAFDLLLSRRSIPANCLGGPGPEPEQLRRLLTAAARVPDHGKLVPWRFIVYRGDQAARAGERLAAIWQRRDPAADAARLELERTRLSRAPVVVGVVSRAGDHPKIPEWEQVLSAGAVCMNLLNAAHAAGFAAQWLTEWYAFDPEAAPMLGLGEGERFAGFIHIGTALEPPFERPRPDLDKIITTWNGG